MAEAIFVFILFVPICIWTLLCPKESILFGRRWQYTEEPELSKESILMARIGAVVGILFCTVFLISRIIALF
jgi:hypothetical protein